MNVMLSEVNEVISIRESEKIVNGVKVISRWVELSTSTGLIKTKVGNGIEIQEGFAGKAIFILRSINSTVQYSGQRPQPVTYFLPSELIKWEQGNKVNNDVSGLLSSLLTSKNK